MIWFAMIDLKLDTDLNAKKACLQSGMNDYIGKPISQKHLSKLLSTCLDNK